MDTSLVVVRFHSARASLCGVHYGGIDYEVPEAFARQVVERELVAEYTTVPEHRRTKPTKR